MAISTSKEFTEYAWYSVQVDQYFASIRIFARHYEALKKTYWNFPKGDDWPKDLSCLSDQARTFFITAASTLNYMGTTQIFAPAPYPELNELPRDIINFGFITCLCFQWTLFENFVKQSVMSLASDGLLKSPVASELRSLEFRTKAFLSCIDSGKVFGDSPFTTTLPVVGWTPQFEDCDFKDLDLIREKRNDFIHAVENPSLQPFSEIDNERFYGRSMSIMRDFAGNVDRRAQDLRKPTSESTS